MKILIVTQVIDSEDPVLGFFVQWVAELAKHAERVEVICLKEGKYELPPNVHVHSLKKERGAPRYARRLVYTFRFLRLSWRLRNGYDAVFVHMNQEYVLIAGFLWKLLGKRIYLWRNHYAGSWLTDLAATFCTKVFCTSKHSYTAKYTKTMLMPVGVDTNRFKIDSRITREPHSILFLSRMSPSKRPEMLIDALASLAVKSQTFNATFVGSPLPQDVAYYESLKEKVRALSLTNRVQFFPGVPNAATPDLYRAHQIFVNTSLSGMFDKTLFEAAACGCTVLSSSKDFADLAGDGAYFGDAVKLSERLAGVLQQEDGMVVPAYVKENSLELLAKTLFSALH